MLERKYIEVIDEEMFSGEINGLMTYVIPKKGYSKSFAMLTVRYGSNDIKFSIDENEMKEYPLGIAHFLEHKLFEEKEGNIFDRFALLGSSPNAYTNFNATAYYFTATNSFEANLELLIKFMFNPYFTKENVEKEKGIIEQEIKMYDDNPGFRVYFGALQSMYENHPIKNDIAGTVSSIKEITPDLLNQCYNTFYKPQNMILVVVGEVDIEKISSIANKLIPTNRGNVSFNKYNYKNKKGICKKQRNLKMGLSIPNFIIGFKEELVNGENNLILKKKISMDIISKMFFSKSSDIYEVLYSKGLINDSFEYEYTIQKEYSHFILGGESKDPVAVKDYINIELEKIKQSDINTIDFKRIKKVLIGSFISKFNSIDSIGNSLSDYFLRQIDIFDYYEVLKLITIEDVQTQIRNIFIEENCVISIVD